MCEYGTLYLCATPIGNLGDITLRVLETLKSVDLIACEDTRKTLKLLNHFQINKPVTSYYEHNKLKKGDFLLAQLMEGKNVALVSDAGMPGISDPGYELVREAIAKAIPFTVLPGAQAAATALVLSGLPTERFAFEGFLPRQKNQRKAHLEKLAEEERTMIFYEAPHRLLETLNALAEAFGNDRQMAAARELTKKFEQVIRGSIGEVISYFENNAIKGEFVLVVDGAEPVVILKDLAWAEKRVLELQEQGLSQKEAIKAAAKEADLPKRELYNLMMTRKNED